MLHHLNRLFYITWRVFLRLVFGKQRRDTLLASNRWLSNLSTIRFGKGYRVARLMGDLVQVKVPPGILLQPKGDLNINTEVYGENLYDLTYRIRKRDIVVDVGAHIGCFALKAASKARNGLVLAIEPHPRNFQLLSYNIAFNKLTNVVVKNIALSNYNGVIKLYLIPQYYPPSSGIHSTALKISDNYLEVPPRTLDTVLAEEQIETVDMLKIDAEGAELDILKGAEKTLKKNNIYLSIAAYHTPTEAEEVSKFLSAIGFNVSIKPNHFVYAHKDGLNAHSSFATA